MISQPPIHPVAMSLPGDQRDTHANQAHHGAGDCVVFGAPQIAGWEIAVRERRVRATSAMFYDMFETRHGLALIAGDVYGGPVGPVASCARRALQTTGAHPSASETLASCAQQVNMTVAAARRDDAPFATLFVCIVETATGIVRYINAGYRSPLLINKLGIKRVLDAHEPALGLFEGHAFAARQARLYHGEALLALSDGNLSRNGQRDTTWREHEQERMMTSLDLPCVSANALLAQLDAQLTLSNAHAYRSDDTLVLVAHRLFPQSPPADTPWTHSC